MTHPFDLSGRVAVVTGGNGGIGLGMARCMAACGASVAIWGRNPKKNAEALESLQAEGADAAAIPCEVTEQRAIDEAMAATLQRFGRVDGMFANAGVSSSGARQSFVERSLEDWHKLFAVNLDGVVMCAKAAARHMIDRAKDGDRGGRIVLTSSVASVDGAAFNEHYGASKAAVNGLMRATAVELARHGVTVNSILPGYIVTEMTEGIMGNEKFLDHVGKRIPVRRFGEPSDFGGLAAYLLSPLSVYHTGQSFVIDGGYTIF